MTNALRRLFTVQYEYVNPTLRQRARGLILMIWAALGFIVLFVVVRGALSLMRLSTAPVFPIELVIAAVVLIITYRQIQRGRLDAAIWLFIGLMLVPFVVATAIAVDAAAPVVLLLPLVAAGLLLNRRSLIAVLVIFAVTLALRAVNQSGTVDAIRYAPNENTYSELINYGILFGLSAFFLLVFSGSAEQIAAVSFTDAEQLKVLGTLGGRLDEQATENTILNRVLEMVERDIGFDLAQVYLSDSEGHYTRRLRLGLGQVEMGTRVVLRPGDDAVINEAILDRKPVMTTLRDSLNRREHLVPPSVQSVTLALIYGDQVYGVLDVQTERREMFTENIVAGLQNLAAQAARAMAQASLIAELERSGRDQEALISRFRDQMSELQRRSESTAVIGWSRYLEGRGQSGFGFDYEGGSLVSANDLPDQIRRAVQQGDVYLEQRGADQIVNVPITLRDQVLGALTFAIPADHAISERQVDMLRTVANRLAVALESNRLLEQTQAQAQRERKANEIGSVLLSETDMEAVLSLAAENFNEALGAIHTRVYLQPSVLTGDAPPMPAQEQS